MRPHRPPRGFVLLVVLMLLVVLTMVASLAYTRAADHLVISTGLRRQSVAQDRALLGTQRGLGDWKTTPKPAYLATLSGTAPCTTTKSEYCFPPAPAPAAVTLAPVTGADGPQYQLDFVRWLPPGGTATLVVIRAIGFQGNNPTAFPGSTQFTSVVLVEMSEGKPNEGGCVGYCGGGL